MIHYYIFLKFIESQLATAEPLLPVLLESFDKGVKQPLMVPLVCESLAAALLIVKLSSLGHHLGEFLISSFFLWKNLIFILFSDSTLTNFWKSVFDKGLFTSKKFLMSLNDDSMLS